MRDEQFKRLLAEIQAVRSEASHKGHFWVLILLIAIAIKTNAC